MPETPNQPEAQSPAKTSNDDTRRAFVKTAVKAAVAAPAVALILDASTKPASAAPPYGFFSDGAAVTSDLRLKQDVCPVEILPNGLQLYSFRYWNDDRTFIGVMAQDLLKDERFRHAVSEGGNGYYAVDLAALGLDVVGSREEFFEASQRALDGAEPVIN
jgi:hypothetical protein